MRIGLSRCTARQLALPKLPQVGAAMGHVCNTVLGLGLKVTLLLRRGPDGARCTPRDVQHHAYNVGFGVTLPCPGRRR